MSLLRFDPVGLFSNNSGITNALFATFAEPLATLRTELFVADGPDFTSPFRRPEKLLTEYEALREKSELGRVFRVANRLHDHLDAVAVIGGPSALGAPAALMRACCEPYHNELSRSARGSKPRLYFATSLIDNDAVEGLLRRLAIDSEIEGNPAASRYAVIAIDDGHDADNSRATAISLRLIGEQLAASLDQSNPDTVDRWLAKLIIAIAPETGPVRARAEKLGGETVFSLGKSPGGTLGVYSAANLLPAALLGLDCIQFLVGAAAMNEHFITAPFAENVVLQSVAANLALTRQHDVLCHYWQIWHPALDGFSPWLRSSAVAACSANAPAATVTHHLLVDTVRTDPIKLHPDEANTAHGEETTPSRKERRRAVSAALPDFMKTAVSRSQEQQRAAGQPHTSLILPQINTHTLGQLFQMMWLADELNTAFRR
jgi:glucose-6-phosphate isomerase